MRNQSGRELTPKQEEAPSHRTHLTAQNEQDCRKKTCYQAIISVQQIMQVIKTKNIIL